MPLNDHEQKILDEIEAQFYRQDPKLADRVRNASVGIFGGASMVWIIIGFLLGLGLMMFFFPQSGGTPLAVVGFVIMVGSAWAALRRLDRSGDSPHRQSLGNGVISRLRSKWQRGA
ncbi:MAG: DUF3040 domain-containing protein [Acidimicrobiia bacterium]|nr:DUF3040 domain-containing protein [Acidimicrobiia bacterium]